MRNNAVFCCVCFLFLLCQRKLFCMIINSERLQDVMHVLCRSFFFLPNCLTTYSSLSSSSSAPHPRFCLWVMSQGAARGPRYLHQYLASFPLIMGDMGAWQKAGEGAVGQGRDRCVCVCV